MFVNFITPQNHAGPFIVNPTYDEQFICKSVGGHLKLLLLTALIVGFHSLSQANDKTAIVMTGQGRLLPAEVVTELNAIKVEASKDGDLITVVANSEKARLIGKLSPENQQVTNMLLFLNPKGQITTSSGLTVGQALDKKGAAIMLVTDLEGKIATLNESLSFFNFKFNEQD